MKGQTEVSNIFELGSLILVNSKCWGTTKKIPKHVIAELMNSDDDEFNNWIRSNKDLTDKDALFNIKSRITKFRNIISNVALPCPLEGFAFVPKDSIPEIAKELDEVIDQFETEVDEFCKPDNYEKIIEKARKILGRKKLFNRKDYPKNIRGRFALSYRFVDMTIPGELKTVSPKLYKEEQEKYRKLMEDTRNEAVVFLREAFLDIVNHIVSKLTEDDTPKRLRQDTLDKLDTFFHDFKTKNIFKDKELSAIIDEARDAIFGLEASDLRDSKKLKNKVCNKLEEVSETLEKSITKFRRSISLD